MPYLPKPEKKKTTRTSPQSKKKKRVYNSTQWQQIRTLIKQRDKVCRYSQTPQQIDHIDHIIPLELAPHLKYNLDNLQGLNISQHSEKTKIESICLTTEQWFKIVFPFHCKKLRLSTSEIKELKKKLTDLL